MTTNSIIECRDALAFPGDHSRAVVMRRVVALRGTAMVQVRLDVRASFGEHPMTVQSSNEGRWEGHSGPVHFRWTGAPDGTVKDREDVHAEIELPEGAHHDPIRELSHTP